VIGFSERSSSYIPSQKDHLSSGTSQPVCAKAVSLPASRLVWFTITPKVIVTALICMSSID
jgi:hypothetical protein